MEIQIGQLTQVVQKELKDSFPSDTEKNLKDCMTVILRSGRELDEREVKRRTLRKRNKQKYERNLNITVPELLRERKQHKCSPINRGRRKKLQLPIL